MTWIVFGPTAHLDSRRLERSCSALVTAQCSCSLGPRGLTVSAGAGQDAINRLAAQVQSWLEEMDPLGKTRFAKTNPAGLALQWTEPPG